jgi:formamidopyrimidine-DNA glycosylase
MPELPEVETTRLGITPHILHQTVTQLVVREPRLRWPVPEDLAQLLKGRRIESVTRRAKYLLLAFEHGTAILHLGMSGSLRIVDSSEAVGKHDHVDFVLAKGKVLRLTDPRRFGALLWQQGVVEEHSLLASLGPEPLVEGAFDGERLYQLSRGRKVPVKNFIMDNTVVVGVGNIYANEALFAAGIRPDRASGRISLARYQLLAETIRHVLAEAISQGGTTLKDFVGGDGRPGYFKQKLKVYGRGGMGCLVCGCTLMEVRIGQRASVYCKGCQR